MKTFTRLIALLLATSLSFASIAQTLPADPPKTSPEEVQPKFIWGMLLNFAFKIAMQLFGEWLSNKLTTDLADTSKFNKILLNSASAAVVSLAGSTLFENKSIGAQENAVLNAPTKPVELENGKPNYQGVHVAVVGFDKAGTAIRVIPIAEGFRTGDRIKLKVLPTFDGLLVIENINPQANRAQIYPAGNSQVVSVKAGVEIFVPLAKDEFFEFAGGTGEEQLVITLRDPRAFGAAQAKAVASRKDEKSGSSFVQETTGGTYPVISQSIKLNHSR
jgi:hypothetical protein